MEIAGISPWLLWVGGIVGGLILGALLVFAIYGITTIISGRRLKKKLPNVIDRKMSDEMLNPGKATELSIKEVQEDERRKIDKYREFEKLRRLDEGKSAAQSNRGIYARTFSDEQRTGVQIKASDIDSKPDNKARRTIKFD